jgi:hypothetical protein
MRRYKLSIFALLLCLLAACSDAPENPQSTDQMPVIYPDYVGVTIPAGIAPLNFNMADTRFDRMDVVVKGSRSGEMHVNGEWADFDIDEWHAFTQQNVGGQLTFTVCARADGTWTQYRDFKVDVSSYPLKDYGLTYRRIPPGYEVGGNIGIYQRDLHTFEESAIVQETALPGRCFNCHTPNRADPRWLTMQIRGEGGGTMVQIDGKQLWLNTKTDSTKAAGSYAYWHPSGNYCAYAVNTVHQSFFTGAKSNLEVYHRFSDVVVLDVRSNELLLTPLLQTDDLEIFPAFSGDGKTLYYSSSKPCNVPAEYLKVKCSLVALSFDASTGTFGTEADTLLNGPLTDKSYTLARPSYDGRWLMYCVSSRSNFPVAQRDADLWLMDLRTGETRSLTEVNSDCSESYHNWSSDSRWFVFSSKREDGAFTKLYLACVDDHGKVSKPFLLPQRAPRRYYASMFDAYNVPDFTKTKVEVDIREMQRQVTSEERKQVKIR